MKLKTLRFSKRKACSLLIVAAAIAIVCGFLRIHRPSDLTAYREMARECHPIWRQFAFRQFGRGDLAADLLQQHPANSSEAFGRYSIYRYHGGSSNDIPFTSFTVIAKDGKLVTAAATSCTWQFAFFYAQDSEFDREYTGFTKERYAAYKRRLLDNLGAELQKFCSRYSRWPTNEIEFSDFVTQQPSTTTNDLGVAFQPHGERIMDLALIQLPGEHISVTNPAALPK